MNVSDAIHILVFDEEPALLAVLRSALEVEDNEVSEAGSQPRHTGNLAPSRKVSSPSTSTSASTTPPWSWRAR